MPELRAYLIRELTMQAIGYFYVPEGGGDALAERQHEFAAFCKKQGYEMAATFLDVSGRNGDMSGYTQLLAFLKRPERGMVVVVVPSPGDLGRTPREIMRSYFDLDSLGVNVVCLDGTPDLARAVLAAWPTLQNGQDAGEKVRDAMRRKAIKGEVLGRAAYGYKSGARRRLQIVPAEAAVVRYIFRLYLRDGLGIRLIARHLNEEGFHTRRGGLWSMVGVRDILRNRVYLGTYSRLGVRVPYSHPAIISQDDFRRVQERLNSRRPSSTNRETALFLLSGLLYCGSCGNKMTGVTRRQRWQRSGDGGERSAMYRYYQCQSRINQSVCSYRTHRANDLEEAVRQALLGKRGTVVEAMPQAGDAEAALHEAQKRCDQLKTKMARLEKRLETYLEAAATGRVSYERLRNLGSSMAEQRLVLLESLEEAQQQAQRQSTAAERLKKRSEALVQLTGEWDYMTPVQRQALLRDLVDRITAEEGDIKVTLSH